LHQVFINLLINLFQVVNLVDFFYEAVQECLGKCALQEASFKHGFAYDHSEKLEHGLIIIELFTRVVWAQFPIRFILLEEGIFRIKNLVTELSDEFFEKTTSVDTFFNHTLFV